MGQAPGASARASASVPPPAPGGYSSPASGGYALRTDAGAVAFQAAFDCAGAYLSSVAYTIARKQLPAQSLRAQSAVMLGVTVTLGVYAGLGTAYAVANIARTFSSDDDS